MADATVIGRGTRIRGRVSGSVDLEIQGHIEGEVTVEGDVTVDAHGLVGANVSGRRLVVRGAVKGDLVGEEAVVLEDGARVVGDVRAPRVAIGPGALVKGYVQTGGIDGSARGKGGAATRALPRPAAVPSKQAAPAPAARPAAKAPPPKPVAVPASAKGPQRAPIAIAGGQARRAPPPPVVPVLKKVKGALHKKKG
jgi:cytoskeletal protein CcmA (bactofilin family)